jgi:hypothetical protein
MGTFKKLSTCAVALILAACAGKPAQPEAASVPTPEPSPSAVQPPPDATATPESSPADAGSTESAAAPSEPPAPAEEAPEPSPKLSRSPINVLTARDVAFMIDYGNSGAKALAEQSCEPKASDPAARAECMTKARDAFAADVLVFKQEEGGGRTTLTIFKRKGSALSQVLVAGIAFKDETDNSVTIVFKGGEKGVRALFRNAGSAVITLPNEYSIEINDPTYGKLPYDAKVGLMGN